MDPVSSMKLFRSLRFAYEDSAKSYHEDINTYLLPGRLIHATQLQPETNIELALDDDDVVNDHASDALRVLTSILYGTLAPPTIPWFSGVFKSQQLKEDHEAVTWLNILTNTVLSQYSASNFYTVFEEFLEEAGGYCTAALRFDSMEDNPEVAYTFERVPTGTYLFKLGYDGQLTDFLRVIFRTPAQIVDEFGEEDAGERIAQLAEDRGSKLANANIALIEHTAYEPFGDEGQMPVTHILFDPIGATPDEEGGHVVEEKGYHEFPYYVVPFESVANTDWGTGPGIKSLSNIKRIQEMERAVMLTIHKKADPPYTVPNDLYGKVNTLPGGETVVSSVMPGSQKIESLYDNFMDESGTIGYIQQLESRISKKFYNDLLLSLQRDPNASPFKAKQIENWEEDRWLRLGPVVTRTYTALFRPMIVRSINILLRRFDTGWPLIPEPPMSLVNEDVSYSIELISPLAKSQNIVALQPVNNMLAITANIANIKPEVLDNLNEDETISIASEMVGAPIGMWNTKARVNEIRKQRQEQQAAMMQQQAALQQKEMELKQQEVQIKATSAASKAVKEQTGE